jgi:hypothetical protein
MSEPTTPKAMEGIGGGGGNGMTTLGRVPSISLGTSFDQIKGHRGSWGQSNSGWNGLNNFRNTNSNVSPSAGMAPGAADSSIGGAAATAPNGGMSGILRKFSFNGGGAQPLKGGNHMRGTSSSAIPVAPSQPPQQVEVVTAAVAIGGEPAEVTVRGRQASVSIPKRRPSPMGERLLMGHFNAHWGRRNDNDDDSLKRSSMTREGSST